MVQPDDPMGKPIPRGGNVTQPHDSRHWAKPRRGHTAASWAAVWLITATGCYSPPAEPPKQDTASSDSADNGAQPDVPKDFDSGGAAEVVAGPEVIAETSGDTGLAKDAEDVDSDPYCHLDCFGGAFCSQGVVTSTLAVPVPCYTDIKYCPTGQLGTCALGCALKAGYIEVFGSALQACREGELKALDLPCTATADCMPSKVQLAPGAAAPVIAVCDPVVHKCVAQPGGPLSDFGTPCDALNSPQVWILEPGLGEHHLTALCGGGVCSRLACPPNSPCGSAGKKWGCTGRCQVDADCPGNAHCKAVNLSVWPQVPGQVNICVFGS
jgi:hypothetical protein